MQYDRHTYRGKSGGLERNGQWVYGNLVRGRFEQGDVITFRSEDGRHTTVFVDTATIGQCTGKPDRYDKAIFEGDVVLCYCSAYDDSPRTRIVRWSDELAMWGCQEPGHDVNTNWDGEPLGDYWHTVEVVGNVHDNPELVQEVQS